MSESLEYYKYAEKMLARLPKGAFLSVKADDRINTMTIGWGTIGYMWKKPVIMVAVRYSRFTYELIEKAHDFSISIPLDDKLKKLLAAAGTTSGRDIDKFSEFELTARDGKTINSPVIGECELIYECKIIYKQPLDPMMLDTDIKEKFYTNNDYHVFYFGEILTSYINESNDEKPV